MEAKELCEFYRIIGEFPLTCKNGLWTWGHTPIQDTTATAALEILAKLMMDITVYIVAASGDKHPDRLKYLQFVALEDLRDVQDAILNYVTGRPLLEEDESERSE